MIAPDSALPLSPLAGLLPQAPASIPFCDVLTPQSFDAPGREWSALTTATAVHDLGWLRRVAVRGEDRLRWLSGMVTNTVEGLAPHSGAWNLVLTAQGRIQGDLTVWRGENDALELEIAANQAEKLLAHLDKFIIMDDVELEPLNDLTALGLTGPQAAQALAQLGFPALSAPLSRQTGSWNGHSVLVERLHGVLVEHYALWVAPALLLELWTALQEAGAAAVGVQTLEALRMAEAIPTYAIDMVERDLPQETSQMRALHFDKGCYQGQEIVERIRSRGNVHRHLRQLLLEGPLPAAGSELTYVKAAGETAPAGAVTSALELPNGRRLALAMIRAEAEIRPQPFLYFVDGAAGQAKVVPAPTAELL
jgi:aminomethyltransferase